MITLKWIQYETANVQKFKIYRSIIGFTGVINAAAVGKTLQLKVNNNTVQTITFGPDPVASINAQIVGGRAYTDFATTGFIFRSDLRTAPGFVEIVGGTVLTSDELSIGLPRLIQEKSEDKLIAEVLFDGLKPLNEFYEYSDQDGTLHDFYALSVVDDVDVESAKTLYRMPLQSTQPLCIIEGGVCNVEGARIPDALVRYKIAEYSINKDVNCSISLDWLETYTCSDGRFSFAVMQGLDIIVEIPDIGFNTTICVPAESFKYLSDLISTDSTKFKSFITC